MKSDIIDENVRKKNEEGGNSTGCNTLKSTSLASARPLDEILERCNGERDESYDARERVDTISTHDASAPYSSGGEVSDELLEVQRLDVSSTIIIDEEVEHLIDNAAAEALSVSYPGEPELSERFGSGSAEEVRYEAGFPAEGGEQLRNLRDDKEITGDQVQSTHEESLRSDATRHTSNDIVVDDSSSGDCDASSTENNPGDENVNHSIADVEIRAGENDDENGRGGIVSLSTRDTWIRLQRGLELELGMGLGGSDTNSTNISEEEDDDDDDNDETQSHERSITEVIISTEAANVLEVEDEATEECFSIPDTSYNQDFESVAAAENAAVVEDCAGIDGAAPIVVAIDKDVSDENDNGNATLPGAQRIYPSHHATSGDFQDDEDDSSDVVYDLFHNHTPPYRVEALNLVEAVPVELDSSFERCVNINCAAVPSSAISFTSELRNKDTLLQRQAIVDDLVAKLQESPSIDESHDYDESRNVVILRGCGGIGKSVLCSLVVSNRSTLLHFADGIAWLSLSQLRGEDVKGGMTYDIYVNYLESLCEQLNVETPQFNEPIFLPADSPVVKQQKELTAMEAAKTSMCRLLNNRYVLIVLDDVWSCSAVSWLNFSNRMDSQLRLLISTRLEGSCRKAKVIDVGPLSPQEARTLLLRESGCQHAELTTEEESLAAEIVERCSLPVAICIAGRRLSYSLNRYETFQELASEMSAALAFRMDPCDTMFNLTDRCFVGVNSDMLKAAFVALSVIFTTNEGKCRFVSIRAACRLLDALLLPRDFACIDDAISILQRLNNMGLLEREGDMIKIRHDVGQEYGKQIIGDKRKRVMLFRERLSRSLGKRLATKSSKKGADTLTSALQLLFIKEYTDENSFRNSWQIANNDVYILERLIWHVVSSSHPQASLLAKRILSSASFLKRRADTMGVVSCMKAHMHDIEMLSRKVHTNKEKKNLQETIDASVEIISDYIASDGVAPLDVGRSYMLLALTCQQHFRFVNAMEMYSRAYALFLREGLVDEVKRVQERAGKISFKPICLVPKSAESENVIRFECCGRLLAQQNGHIDPNASGVELTLSSHPGMAVCVRDRCQQFPGMEFHELFLGPAESAIKVKYEDDRFVVCNNRKSCLVTGASRGGEGDMLHMGTYRYKNKTFIRKIDRIYEKTKTSDLVVNEDGSMSPRSRRDLVFATRLPHLFLVKRDSPCRVVLKHGCNLKTNQTPFLSQDDTVNHDKVFSGELLSHPDHAICHDVVVNATSKLSGDQMKLGSVADSVHFIHDGQKLATVADGKCKFFLTKSLGVGDDTAFLYLVRDESRKIFKHEHDFGLKWIINGDGSLSPIEFPTHAVGIHSLSRTDFVISETQRMLAKREANEHVWKNRRQSWKQNLRFLRLIYD